jgi:D-hydroxyproline dehydrogenase subunit beta
MEKIVIIGAGLIGAALAFRLSREGAAVTVVEAGLPAQAASGRSFGWINASYSLSDQHFALRLAGMEAHRRLADQLPGHHQTNGCLWWEEEGEDFANTAQRLETAGYTLQRLTRGQVRELEPALRQPPEEALFFPTEGAVDPAALTHALLAASGVQVLSGVPARLATRAGRICGVETPQGPMAADQVVIAAGTGAPALLHPLGLALPMLHRPGLILRTAPVEPRLTHILASPLQELRQTPGGHLLAPVAAAHQADTGAAMADPLAEASATLERMQAMLGLKGLRAESIVIAERPVPGDGLPVVGPVDEVPGLWLAVMHSGVTLAAIVAEMLGAEITGQGERPLLAPFRPARFF